jgi:hypothetical protein
VRLRHSACNASNGHPNEESVMDLKERISDLKNIDLHNEMRHATEGVNIPAYERIVTTALGVAAIYFGTRNRGILGWALAAAGSGLAARGLSGHCAGYRKFMTEGQQGESRGSQTSMNTSSSPYTTGSGLSAGVTTRPQV